MTLNFIYDTLYSMIHAHFEQSWSSTSLGHDMYTLLTHARQVGRPCTNPVDLIRAKSSNLASISSQTHIASRHADTRCGTNVHHSHASMPMPNIGQFKSVHHACTLIKCNDACTLQFSIVGAKSIAPHV